MLVVVSPGYFELDSLVQLSKTLEEVREYFNPDLVLLGYLFTMSEPTINTSASLQILRQTYTEKVLKTVIPRNTDLRDAHFQKQDIFSFNPRAKAALAYDKLIREVFLPEPESTKRIKQRRMKKQLNVDLIQSELRGGSPFSPDTRGVTPRSARIAVRSSSSEPKLQPSNIPNSSCSKSQRNAIQTAQQGVPPPVPRTGTPYRTPSLSNLIPKSKTANETTPAV